MFGMGYTEILMVAGVALLLFGGKKLPGMMRGLGQSINEFKAGINTPANITKEDTNEL